MNLWVSYYSHYSDPAFAGNVLAFSGESLAALCYLPIVVVALTFVSAFSGESLGELLKAIINITNKKMSFSILW